MIQKIKDNIYWIGVNDYAIRNFHGYLTPMGSTYNAYLVIDEQITVIDSVKAPFTPLFLDNIKQLTGFDKIDNIISNHAEPDHSGSLPELARLAPQAKIYATANGAKIIKAYHGMDNINIVQPGQTLRLGATSLQFLPAPMVHWPDSMASYMPELKILFSNDAFGQHIASEYRFDDQLGMAVLDERTRDYYANIVLPFGMQVQKLLEQVGKLDIDVICPSHGIMWRTHIDDIVSRYQSWSHNETDPKKTVIAYDTMWKTTEMLAQRLADEAQSRGETVTLLNMADTHVSTAITAMLEAQRIAIGSPTLNRNVMATIGGLLTYVKGLAPKNRTGIAFGSYGWSGESVGIIEQAMDDMSWQREDSVKVNWRP